MKTQTQLIVVRYDAPTVPVSEETIQECLSRPLPKTAFRMCNGVATLVNTKTLRAKRPQPHVIIIH
jgi:hypothetical protein